MHSWPLGTVNGHGHGHVWLAVPTFQLFASFSKRKMKSFCSRPRSDRKISGNVSHAEKKIRFRKGIKYQVSNILSIFYQHQERFNLNERFCSLILFQHSVMDQFRAELGSYQVDRAMGGRACNNNWII